MPIQNALSSIVSQIAKNPKANFSTKAADSIQDAGQQSSAAQPVVGRKSNSGSGLNLELSLASGQVIQLDIRLNQAGGLSQLSLMSNSELSARDEEKLTKFLTQLSSAVDDLFSQQSDSSSLFQFANQQGIEEVDFNAYLDNGVIKQALDFEKQVRNGSSRKIEAQWYEYNRAKGIEESHDLNLSKQAKRGDQVGIYGSMSYQWLLDQVDLAMDMDDLQGAGKLASFFKSGIQALFSTAHSGSALLQELGASAQQAKDFIGRSIKVLASEAKETSEGQQMNALPDFTMVFSSQSRSSLNQGLTSGNNYQLDMTISQNSDQVKSEDKNQSYQIQNRRLRMNYQSSQQQSVYEYIWTRDESIRHIYEKGSLASKQYRLQETIQSQLLDDVNSKKLGENKTRENKIRGDQFY